MAGEGRLQAGAASRFGVPIAGRGLPMAPMELEVVAAAIDQK